MAGGKCTSKAINVFEPPREKDETLMYKRKMFVLFQTVFVFSKMQHTTLIVFLLCYFDYFGGKLEQNKKIKNSAHL